MSSIHKEKGDLPRLRLLNKRFQGLCFESLLKFKIGFGWNLLHLPTEKPVFFTNSPTCGKERWIPVRAFILTCAFFRVAGGFASKSAIISSRFSIRRIGFPLYFKILTQLLVPHSLVDSRRCQNISATWLDKSPASCLWLHEAAPRI